ncbi:MAG: c-type cytochrome biogenesis protein CcsB, partial [Gammaproteobacteria bacterium]|nr:c-type cytochrome biogenesis protein CcsB [Gammaproteobacteria bacterium]
LMWIAVSLYAAGSILYISGFVFSWPRVTAVATWISLAGLAPHALAIAARWVRVGHAPFLGFYEVVSGLVVGAVLALGLLLWRYPTLGPVGVIIMPLSFLMMGGAMLAPKSSLEVTGKLASWWLTIHITFAKLCYSAFIAAFALALLYLMREKWSNGKLADLLSKLPRQEIIDDLSFKLIGAGFIFLGVMIAAGAIWANEAWGRYWAWDPVETWSLISWIVYAVYLHTRLTMGWRGRKSAWLAVVALPIVVFALIGVPVAYNSIHGAYLTGY